MVKRSWTLSEQLGAGIGLAMLIMGLVLGSFGYITLSNILEDHLQERAESQARQLALFAADAILLYDYATLERYAKELADEPGIISVKIQRNDGETLAQASNPETSSNTSIIEVQQRLHIGQLDIANVTLAVDRRSMELTLQQLALVGFVVLLVLIITVFWIMRQFVERGVIKPVQQMVLAANPLKTDNCPEPKDLPEELARLAETIRGLCGEVRAHLIEREHAEQLARLATERLTREKRLATVGQIAAGLAHNLNTPLGSIKGFAQLLCENLDDPKNKQQASCIVTQAESCAATVRNLLTTVRPPEIVLREFDLYQQVVTSVEYMRPLLRDRGVEVIIMNEQNSEDRPKVMGDCGAVEQILFNLLSNAAQANATEVNIDFVVEPDDNNVVMNVCDNGPGISHALGESLFDPFVTDKAPGEGTGLGLYLSKQLAENMGADLFLSSTSSTNGACFSLMFYSKRSAEL